MIPGFPGLQCLIVQHVQPIADACPFSNPFCKNAVVSGL
jgi:hypothetical protein